MSNFEIVKAYGEKLKKICDYYTGCEGCPLLEGKSCSLHEITEEYYDIVMNWRPPVDWSKVPVDTPILVRLHESDKPQGRYFAKFEDGTVFAFTSGRTSWTANGNVTPWDYAELVGSIW